MGLSYHKIPQVCLWLRETIVLTPQAFWNMLDQNKYEEFINSLCSITCSAIFGKHYRIFAKWKSYFCWKNKKKTHSGKSLRIIIELFSFFGEIILWKKLSAYFFAVSGKSLLLIVITIVAFKGLDYFKMWKIIILFVWFKNFRKLYFL